MAEEQISKSEATRQVRLMGRMLAALYYHFSKAIIAEVGEEKAREIIGKAVWEYGAERGREQRAKVASAGYEHQPEDYVKVADLPFLGWEVSKADNAENDTHIKISYCPFAEYWREKDFAAVGRLYCSVDQAKYTAFHNASEYIHIKNALDGDDCCEMLCRRKDGQERSE